MVLFCVVCCGGMILCCSLIVIGILKICIFLFGCGWMVCLLVCCWL